MVFKDIPKEYANRMIAALHDLRPNISASIISEDPMLFDLGLSPYIPCSLELIMTEDEIDELYDEVIQMEIDAYNYEESRMKESEYAKSQRELEQRYRKYSILEGIYTTYYKL